MLGIRKRARETIVKSYDLKRKALPGQFALLERLIAKCEVSKNDNVSVHPKVGGCYAIR